MRKSIFIVLFCLFATGCGGKPTINGHNIRTANRSLIMMKRALPTDQRLEFEIAFWTLKDAHPKNSDFLDIVDDQTVDEVIELGRKSFNESSAAGITAYTKYASWDDMLDKVQKERAATALPKEPISERDKKNDVLYQL